MKILIIGRYHISDIKGGGQEVAMDKFATYLSLEGDDVSIAAYNVGNGKPYKEIISKENGGSYTAYRLKGVRNSFASRIFGFIKLARELKPDIIIMSSYGYSMYGYFISKFVGCKVCAVAHDEFDVYGFRTPFNFMSPLNRRFTKRLDRVIALNNNVANVIYNETKIKCSTICNGFECMPHEPKKEYRAYSETGEPFKFIFIGRIAMEKGLDYLIGAFSIFNERHPNSKLTIVGGGSHLNRLRSDYSKFKSIEFKGYLPEKEMLDELVSSDCFVNATYIKEGIVLTNLQAMEMGVPVIATLTGASGEAITHGVNGFLISPKKVVPMAVDMLIVAESPDMVKTMADNARISVKKFSWVNSTKEFKEILNGL